MSAQWQVIDLPKGSRPVKNAPGVYLIFPAEANEKYKYWDIYQQHDGTYTLHFSKRIRRLVDEVVPNYNIVRLAIPAT